MKIANVAIFRKKKAQPNLEFRAFSKRTPDGFFPMFWYDTTALLGSALNRAEVCMFEIRLQLAIHLQICREMRTS